MLAPEITGISGGADQVTHWVKPILMLALGIMLLIVAQLAKHLGKGKTGNISLAKPEVRRIIKIRSNVNKRF